ncbi:tetratricopeptide repeat protein [Hugenholtzia roseola]|uniref:tetratricopeptide repeat protein n=1 Tax=Hugenholtzia roseola TaxID=1002 RepID=UPI00041276E5|nr:tetratricopeptide repeat protein [Hugenholtzia roseola]
MRRFEKFSWVQFSPFKTKFLSNLFTQKEDNRFFTTTVKRLPLLFACVLFFLGSDLQAQKQNQAQKSLDSLMRMARYENSEGQLVGALRGYLQALQMANKSQNKELIFDLYYEIGLVYQKGRLHEKAIEYFTKAQEYLPRKEGSQQEISLTLNLGQSLFLQKDYERAIAAYQHVLGFLPAQEKPYARIQTLTQLINSYQAQGIYEKTLPYNEEILNINRNLGDSVAVSVSLNNLGYTHKFLGNNQVALNYFLECAKLERKLKKGDDLITLTNIAIIYQNLNNQEMALKYASDAMRIAEKGNQQIELARIYDLLAAIYFQVGDFYNARLYNEMAQSLAKARKQDLILQNTYLTASEIEQEADNYEKALDYYKSYLTLRDSLLLQERLKQQELLQQQFLIERTEKEMSLLLVDQELKDAALREQALTLEARNQELARLQSEQNLQKATLAQERLEQERNKQALLIANQQLQAEKSARELADLQKQKELQALELAKSNLEKQAKDKEIQMIESQKKLAEENSLLQTEKLKEQEERNFVVRVLLALALLVVILVVLGLFWVQRKNKELAYQKEQILYKNVELEQQTEEIQSQRDSISKKNEELNELYTKVTDSINYAERIQRSILLPESQIIQHFHSAFIFFLPRDVVSGDFYWFAEVQKQNINYKIIAAVDCTGHGVPGAFMSLIGNDLLNEIVNVRKITEAGEILNRLDAGVKSTLKQEYTANRDGMDLALCVIEKIVEEATETDSKTKEKSKPILHYAGAKNPLFYVKEGALHQIKADKMPIGGETQIYGDTNFTTHSLEIEGDEIFYIFSDGYQDQFGGQAGKKFMVKNFKELLLEVSTKPFSAQKEELGKRLKEWQGKKHEQVDDILVIGFRVG